MKRFLVAAVAALATLGGASAGNVDLTGVADGTVSLTVSVVSGTGIEDRDGLGGGKSDAYVKFDVQCDGGPVRSYKTGRKTGTNVSWKESFVYIAPKGVRSARDAARKCKFKTVNVYDHDHSSRDDHIGVGALMAFPSVTAFDAPKSVDHKVKRGGKVKGTVRFSVMATRRDRACETALQDFVGSASYWDPNDMFKFGESATGVAKKALSSTPQAKFAMTIGKSYFKVGGAALAKLLGMHDARTCQFDNALAAGRTSNVCGSSTCKKEGSFFFMCNHPGSVIQRLQKLGGNRIRESPPCKLGL